MKRLSVLVVVFGALLFSSGFGLRAYASLNMRLTETRLLDAKPNSPADVTATKISFTPADGTPSEIRLPGLDLWNTLEPVKEQVSWQVGSDGQAQMALAWAVRDAGWHAAVPPGWGLNVVVAGHSPSLDPATWHRSVFRQLAYLAPGDPIELTAGSRIYRYAVDRVFAIPFAEAETSLGGEWIAPGEAERLTLVTCWPPQSAAYRIVVIAQPVSMKERTYHEP